MRILILLMVVVAAVGCGKNSTTILEAEKVNVEETIQVVKCESHQLNYKECIVPEKVVRVVTLVAHSSVACIEGTNFGLLNSTTLYVDEGCRATFILSDKE